MNAYKKRIVLIDGEAHLHRGSGKYVSIYGQLNHTIGDTVKYGLFATTPARFYLGLADGKSAIDTRWVADVLEQKSLFRQQMPDLRFIVALPPIDDYEGDWGDHHANYWWV